MRSKNILYLHGYAMNEEVMKFQTKRLRRLLPNYTHTILNGPYIAARGPDKRVEQHFKGPFYAQCQFDEPTEHTETQYYGIEQTIARYTELVRQNEIDGIVGFSQGSYIGAMLANAVPLRFLVSVCGMQCMDRRAVHNFEIPSFHIVGERDEQYLEHGLRFHEMFRNAPLLRHSTGHNFPVEKHINQELAEWIDALDLKLSKTCNEG